MWVQLWWVSKNSAVVRSILIWLCQEILRHVIECKSFILEDIPGNATMGVGKTGNKGNILK